MNLKGGITRNVNNLWAELDASGNIAIRYFNGAGANNHLARTGSGIDNAWLLSDRQGSVRTLTDLYGNKAMEIDYDSFGNITREEDSVPFAMTLGATRAFGYYYDSQLTLHLAFNRWYDSVNAVWITEDPIGFDAGDANIRRYVGNNGLYGVDPSGLEDDELTVVKGKQGDAAKLNNSTFAIPDKDGKMTGKGTVEVNTDVSIENKSTIFSKRIQLKFTTSDNASANKFHWIQFAGFWRDPKVNET